MESKSDPRAMIGDVPVYCRYDEIIDIGKAIPNPINPNHHPQNQISLLSKIIKSQGWRQPITISNRSGLIVKGHGRLLAAIELGADQVPVEFQNYETDADEIADLTADNRLSELSEMDNDTLAEILQTLNDDYFDIELAGYTDEDLEKLLSEMTTMDDVADITDDEYEGDIPEVPKSKHGDIYQLGSHRLMCGDSTSAEDIAKLMDGKLAEMCFTSPPYGVELDYNSYDDTFENTKQLVTNVLPIICENVEDYIVLNWGDIVSASKVNGTEHPSQYAWLPLYNELMESNGWYIWAERIWAKPHARCSGIWSASSNRPVSDWEYIFTWAQHNPKFNERQNGSHFGVIDSSESGQSDTLKNHPGAFPVYVAGKVVAIHSKPEDIVLDVFGGSGTTLIACEELDRICYTMEYDPKYVDMIIDRWETFTGQEALLIERAQEPQNELVGGE